MPGGKSDGGSSEAAIVVLAVGDALGDALARTGRVAVHLAFSQDGAQMAFPDDQHPVQDLAAQRRVPTRRSQIAFIDGAWTAVRTIVVPVACKTAPKAVKSDPRSRMRNLLPPDPLIEGQSPGCGPAALTGPRSGAG